MGEWIPAGGGDPVDCSLAADARDAAPYLPRGRVSNVTAQRLRAKILRARKREATKPPGARRSRHGLPSGRAA